MPNTITKTQDISLLTWQDIASAAIVISSAQDVSTKLGASFFIHIGRRTGSAFTAGWPNARIEVSAKASGNDAWVPVMFVTCSGGASLVNTTLNGAVSANASSFVVTANTNIAVGDVLFLGDASAANYELVRVKAVSGTTITPEENVTNSHTTGAIVTDQAEMFFGAIDLTSIARVRAVVDNIGSGQNIAARVMMNTGDSIG